MSKEKTLIGLSDLQWSGYSNKNVRLTLIFAILIVMLGTGQSAEGSAPTTVYTVTNTNDTGTGSLRWAITQANAGGEDTISFNIPTTDPNYNASKGWWVITPLSALPSLTDDATLIDGGLQAVNQGNTNPFGLELVIDGGSLPGSASIFTIESDRNNIQDLTIANAPGPGIRIITGAETNVIANNYIGTDPNGLTAWGNERGVEITSGANNNYVDMSIISGNDMDGILITGNETDYNKVRRSLIGLDATGNAALPNNGNGVWITSGARNNEIGEPYLDDDGYRNWISGNGLCGVRISGTDTVWNVVGNNYIGINYSGDGSVDVGNTLSGVLIENGPVNNFVYYNTISGNLQHGVYVSGSGTSINEINFNIVGANPGQSGLIPNHRHGIAVYDYADHTWIQNNVIVGNGWSGVAIQNSSVTRVGSNHIGFIPGRSYTNMGNKFHGVHISGNTDLTLLLSSSIAYNGIHAGESGVLVDGSGAWGNDWQHSSIHSNHGKGIELRNGGNGGLPAPTITSANCTTVTGTACPNCGVYIYSDLEDEGKFWEGQVAADSSGHFTYTGFIHGPNVTAYNEDAINNGSEFSLPYIGACYTNYLPAVFSN
jgi:hypothetical protein